MTTEQEKTAPAESARSLARRLELPFSNSTLLTRALTHRSFVNENHDALEDNERLEFLGDAILDFLVAAWLYNRFPEMAEGQLTRLRAALVGTRQLAAFARRLDLGSAMRLGKGEIEGGGRNRSTLLCDTFEAVIGALYLDAGLDAVSRFIRPQLEEVTDTIIEQRDDLDAKSVLQEWAQGQGKGVPMYRQVEVSGPDHDRIYTFEVVIDGSSFGSGAGKSKQAAGKAAAAAALQALGIELD